MALAAAAAFTVTIAGPAQAAVAAGEPAASLQPAVSPLCSAGLSCGRVHNRLGQPLRICKNWNACGSQNFTLYPGQGTASNSEYHWRDSDGFYVPAGCTYSASSSSSNYAGGRWHKVNDLQLVVLNGWNCPGGHP